MTTEERFGFDLVDGPQWSMVLHGGGVSTELLRMGRPQEVSEAILAGVGDSQIGPANQAIDAGETVAFGPLSVTADGLVTPGGLVAWPDLVWVRLDDWSTTLFYNPNTQRVKRFVRIFFEIRAVADSAGRPPRPSRFDLPHVPDIDVVRRVAVPEGERLENAEITGGDWQIPNLPTLLRLLRAREKLA
ncbi:hypothetical protein [Asanoa ishikariensis]|uniref:hypothetical protein n=1 Tax=Asanoa ishikariensis TaxID=137265 RepID=UPI00115FCF45|nr:hypothetical protein [Asanoa ishikariensis]